MSERENTRSNIETPPDVLHLAEWLASTYCVCSAFRIVTMKRGTHPNSDRFRLGCYDFSAVGKEHQKWSWCSRIDLRSFVASTYSYTYRA